MKTRSFTFSFASILATLVCGAAPPAVQAQVPVATVSGNGGWFEPHPDGVVLDDIRINAWMDAAGNVGGNATWASVYNGYYGPGPGSSGYTWSLEVTNLAVFGNQALVDAVVVKSPQYPSDIGTQVRFIIIDNGAADLDTPDEIGAAAPWGFEWGPVPISYGNFTVRSGE